MVRARAVVQHFVGLALRDGHGVEQDDEAAVVWFKKAASAGRAEAQYALALCCEHGIGTEKRWVEALGWFELAAAQGHAEAIERLEVNLQVPVREEVAEEKWCDAMKAHMQRHLVDCEQLALEGDACAMFHWARCHIQAWGMPPNLPLGAQWMAKAAAKRWTICSTACGMRCSNNAGKPAMPVSGDGVDCCPTAQPWIGLSS